MTSSIPDKSINIGDQVWFDADSDGLQDAGEPGIPGAVDPVGTDGASMAAFTTSTVDDLTIDAGYVIPPPGTPAA